MLKNKFRPSILFRNNMVLQREKPLEIRGSGPDGDAVSVEIQGCRAETRIRDGRWSLILPPLRTSYNEKMLFTCGGDVLEIENILIGEVWIAGGQSNMEFFIRYDEGRDEVLKDGENKNIRFFDYPEVSYPGQLEEFDYSRYGIWRTCDPSNLEYFSAVAYYFARKLEKDLNVPIGIIGCNWGGTPACAWIAPKYLEDNAGRIWLDEYNEAVRDLDYNGYDKRFMNNPANFRNDIFNDPVEAKLMSGISRQQMDEFMKSPEYTDTPPESGPKDPNRPGGLYETMLTMVAPFPARGIIWYQGESDDRHPQVYDIVFSSLIKCWRDAWGEDLPFLFVQLAPFKQWLHCYGKTYPVLRLKQEKVSKNIPGTWMASIMDSGMEFDIHPKRKKPVGERLAMLAEGKVYSFDLLCESPEFSGIKVGKGRALLSFRKAGEGLHLKGDVINALELFIDSRQVEYEAEISGRMIILKNDMIEPKSRIEIRFAYCDYCEVNLYNSAGIPAKPFVFIPE